MPLNRKARQAKEGSVLTPAPRTSYVSALLAARPLGTLRQAVGTEVAGVTVRQPEMTVEAAGGCQGEKHPTKRGR